MKGNRLKLLNGAASPARTNPDWCRPLCKEQLVLDKSSAPTLPTILVAVIIGIGEALQAWAETHPRCCSGRLRIASEWCWCQTCRNVDHARRTEVVGQVHRGLGDLELLNSAGGDVTVVVPTVTVPKCPCRPPECAPCVRSARQTRWIGSRSSSVGTWCHPGSARRAQAAPNRKLRPLPVDFQSGSRSERPALTSVSVLTPAAAASTVTVVVSAPTCS